MIVTHNISAMNAQRQLSVNTKNKSKSAEKLSSGYRINRAADDAAGLQISEKLRRLIRGLDRGCDNVQDGISLVKVADGAMAEATDILQRVNVLTIQAYNGTNSNADREIIQNEIDEHLKEINRISDVTKFNEMYVFEGRGTWVLDTYSTSVVTELPDWVKVDKTMSFDNSEGLTAEQKPHSEWATRTASGLDTLDVSDDVIEYTGNNYNEFVNNYKDGNGDLFVADIVDKGQFTDTLTDNAVMTMDYSALANSKNAKQLQDRLLQLVGTSIGASCNTCDDLYYGVTFTGENENYTVSKNDFLGYAGDSSSNNGKNVSRSFVNINEITFTDGYETWSGVTLLSAIDDAVKGKKASDMVQTAVRNILQDDKADANKISTLAKAVTKRLCDKIVDEFIPKSSSYKYANHFNKIARESDYKIVLYDFRDKSFFGNTELKPKEVKTSAIIKQNRDIYVYHAEIETRKSTKIQCSSGTPDQIIMDLPLISLKALGLEKYNINKYSESEEIDWDETNRQREETKKNFEYQCATYNENYKKYLKLLEKYKKDKKEYDKRVASYYPETYNKLLAEWNTRKAAYDNDSSRHLFHYVYDTSKPKIRDEVYYDEYPFESYDEYGEKKQGIKREKHTRPIFPLKLEKVPYEDLEPKPPTQSQEQPPEEPQMPEYPKEPDYDAILSYKSKYDPDDVKKVGDAIAYISAERARLGAYQNRLEHTYNNNRNIEENTQSAESVIRDTNMADEMVNNSKHNLLEQVGQSILAQANQSTNGVMSILQG